MLIEANALSPRRLPIFNFTNQALTLDTHSELRDNHVLILHGGGDISPALYNKPVAPRGGGYYKPSHRDQQEWMFIKEAVKQNIPIVGICRGAQMLCAFDGGELVQHINNQQHQSTDSIMILNNVCMWYHGAHSQLYYARLLRHLQLSTTNLPIQANLSILSKAPTLSMICYECDSLTTNDNNIQLKQHQHAT